MVIPRRWITFDLFPFLFIVEEEEEEEAATDGRQEGRTRGGSLETKGCRSDSVVDLLMVGGASQGGDTRK